MFMHPHREQPFPQPVRSLPPAIVSQDAPSAWTGGIAGLWRRQEPALLDQMLRRMASRGSDGWAMWTAPDGSALLGQARLALTAGVGDAQPVASADGSLCLLMSGQLYNYWELRARLSGHDFQTRTTAEVVLHLYEKMGSAAFAELEGIFALALWDGRDGSLTLVRDRLGVKPLYYAHDQGGALLFASEAQAVAAAGLPVQALAPGTWWRTGHAPERYWQQPAPQGTISDPAVAAGLVDRVVQRVVQQRLTPGVDLGLFLSGGLDSSLIAAHARRMAGRRIHSFAVGLPGAPDLAAARAIATDLDLIHHEWELTAADVLTALPQVARALHTDAPDQVRRAVPIWLAAHLAAEHVQVVLTGDGADELFAGRAYLTEFSPDPAALDRELFQAVGRLHQRGLQRLERMTAAHGLEARVPFLDHKLVAVAAQIDPELKWRGSVGKWVLRQAALPYLPGATVCARQLPFASGSGIDRLLGGC